MSDLRKALLLGLMVALAVSGLISQTALAGGLKWKVEGKANTAGGKIVFVWRNAMNVIVKEVECKKFTDKDVLLPRGRDEITAMTYEECEQIFPAAAAAAVTAVGLPWPSVLVRLPGGQIVDVFTARITVTVGGKESTIEGALGGEWKNSTGETDFPETALEDSDLTSEGDKVTISGSDKYELEGGGKPEVEEEAEGTGTSPSWSVKGTRLKESEAHNITAKAFSASLELSTPEAGIVVKCTKLKAKEGLLWGSNGENPGTSTEIVEFSECSVTGNGTTCKVSEPITTNQLESELVENVESKKVGKKLLVEFFPTSGTNFATLVFSGECKIKETKVTGKVAAEALTDPGEEAIELGQSAKQAKSWLFKFPASPVKEVWLVKAGTGSAVKVELTAFGDTSVEEGTALVSLANGKLEAEETEWSPLP